MLPAFTSLGNAWLFALLVPLIAFYFLKLKRPRVAIPSLVIYSVLQGRTQHMVDDINEAAVSVLNLVVANREKMRMPTGNVSADDD